MTVRWGCHFCSPGWRELCCSRGCWCPGRGNCWNCPRRRCHWPHQTVCSPTAWWAAHPRPRTPLPSEWALPPPSHPAGDRKGRKHYPRNPGVLRRGTRWLSTPHSKGTEELDLHYPAHYKPKSARCTSHRNLNQQCCKWKRLRSPCWTLNSSAMVGIPDPWVLHGFHSTSGL